MGKSFEKPNGVCFYTEDPVDAETLASTLRSVARALQSKDPYVRLHRYDDWWEHDGLHFHRLVIDFHTLFELLHSPRSLLESTPTDDSVFVGIAPESDHWYLRYRVEWNDDETSLDGRCAIIIEPDMLDLHQELERISWLRRIDSETYYTETLL